MNKVPYNEAAELSLIAGVLMWPSETADMAQGVAPEDLYSPFARNIWTIFLDLYCAKGQKIDFVAIRDELTRLGLPFDPSELMSILTSHTKPTPHTVKIILRDSWARQFLGAMTQATQDVYQGGDPYDISDQIQRFTRDRSFSGLPEALTIEELEAQFETATPWVVPGILRQDWRILVVAGEGGSKSVTLRSILMCAAQGFHAFNHKPIDPQRVLSVDLENPRDAVLETGSPLKRHLMRMAGDTYDPTRYRVWKRLQGINIRKRADRAELTREIENQKPSIVAIGPWNKMGRKVKGEDHEDMAADMLAILDDLRIKYEFALMIEHHAPKGQHGSQRVLDPFGSQRLMAWPEIGISLRADPDAPKDSGVIRVERHRGDRMKNGWPEWILRDPDWMVQGKWPLEQEVREKLGSHTGGY